MTKRTLALRCSFLVGCVLFLVDLPVAISQEVAVSTPTYTLKLSSGPPLPGTTNSAPLTNITFQTTQTITNASNGPVWQTAWTVQGTNGLISVFAQTTTSVRTTMSLSPPSSLTASDTTSGASMELARPHTEDLLSSPPLVEIPTTPTAITMACRTASKTASVLTHTIRTRMAMVTPISRKLFSEPTHSSRAIIRRFHPIWRVGGLSMRPPARWPATPAATCKPAFSKAPLIPPGSPTASPTVRSVSTAPTAFSSLPPPRCSAT